MSSEFLAAVVGALVGGSIAGLLQVLQQGHERSLRTVERMDQQRMLAYSLFYKLMILSSAFRRISHHIESAFETAPEGQEPWQFLEAYATQHRHVSFSAEEMTMLLRVSVDSFNEIAALDEVHNALSDTLVAYGNRKERINQMLPPSEMTGRKGGIQATHDQYMAARPTMIEASGIAQDMRASAKRDAIRTLQAMKAVVPKLNRTLDMKLGFEEKRPEEWLDSPKA